MKKKSTEKSNALKRYSINNINIVYNDATDMW